MGDDNVDKLTSVDAHVVSRRKFIQKLAISKSIKVRAGEGGKLYDDSNRPPVGLAFSGGGIRSATVSLGVAEALAVNDRLYGFDFMSTVSGGGYFGSFLKSLYLPDSKRGPQTSGPQKKKPDSEDRNTNNGGDTKSESWGEPGWETIDSFYFAHHSLRARPNEKRIRSICKATEGKEVYHPLRWLREQGRYLAPNGAGDYVSSITYIVRNWIGMLFVFAVAILAIQLIVQLFMIGAIAAYTGLKDAYLPSDSIEWLTYVKIDGQIISPLIWPVALAAFVSFATGGSYWMTRNMRYNPDSRQRNQMLEFSSTWWWCFLAWTVCALGTLIWLEIDPDYSLGAARSFIYFALALTLTSLVVAAIVYLRCFGLTGPAGDQSEKINQTSLIRRSLLNFQNRTNLAMIAFAVLAVLDSFALILRDELSSGESGPFSFSVGLLLMQPVLAFLLRKIPEWLGGSETYLFRRFAKYSSFFAMLLGIFLYGILALVATYVVQMAMWTGSTWTGDIDPAATFVFAMIVTLLTIMIGISNGFINLSSLHALYASKLTRAYLGGSNIERLAAGAENPTGSHPKDHIDAQTYFEDIDGAPFHMVNFTINDTHAGDNLIAQDRKGRRAHFCYDGLCVESGKNSWAALEKGKVEKFSIGQLCAISGAAASSGMGRLTTLGNAIALTYANVRLGYWWDRYETKLVLEKSPGDVEEAGIERIEVDATEPAKFGMQFLSTFVYLYNEMTARYSSKFRRLYLSDGGHSENSGALALLEKECKAMLVADNAQDPDYEFSDLEIFVRTARIDLGYRIHIAKPKQVREFYGGSNKKDCNYFLNLAKDWRLAARNPKSKGFALLLIAEKIPPAGEDASDDVKHIIWLKPKLFDRVPADIAAYAEANENFPQQTTADQFFDEAQWESYRRLGFEMAMRLFKNKPALTQFPVIEIKKFSDTNDYSDLEADREWLS